ncbi:MAG: hypothetical protein M3450_18115, partial [Actinomycetota bacterium]|nr:hypothetical protein [Actinomycetota bacterium]
MGRRRIRTAVAAVMLLGLAACSGGGSSDGAIDGSAGATGNWEDIRPAPIAGRSPAALAWTGKEMVVWGGGTCKANPCQFDNVEPLGDGGAYTPSSDTWRTIATSPLTARRGVASAWTGRELLIWGGGVGTTEVYSDGAAYD